MINMSEINGNLSIKLDRTWAGLPVMLLGRATFATDIWKTQLFTAVNLGLTAGMTQGWLTLSEVV